MATIAKNIYYYGTGRDKTSTARVFMSKGTGQMNINGKTIEQYFGRPTCRMVVMQALEAVGLSDKFDFKITASGGGSSGQSDAIRLGIARALLEWDSELRSTLRKSGFLTRDHRRVERKKYGLRKARKKEQFSKR